VTTNTLNNVAKVDDINVLTGKIDSMESQLENKADISHTHLDLQESLDNKADASHTHLDLQESLDNKADASHTHEYIDFSNKLILYKGNISSFLNNSDGVYNIKPNGNIIINSKDFKHIIINSSFYNDDPTLINELKTQLNKGMITYGMG
jgi:hypothetical protein